MAAHLVAAIILRARLWAMRAASFFATLLCFISIALWARRSSGADFFGVWFPRHAYYVLSAQDALKMNYLHSRDVNRGREDIFFDWRRTPPTTAVPRDTYWHRLGFDATAHSDATRAVFSLTAPHWALALTSALLPTFQVWQALRRRHRLGGSFCPS